MKLSVDFDEDYPPRFIIEVLGETASECDVLHVSFSGADRELELQKPLQLVLAGS